MLLIINMAGCFQKKPAPEEQASMHWLEDKTGTMTFDDILKQDLSTQWHTAQLRYPNFGFSSSIFWLSLPFENKHDIETSMLLEIAFPLHDKIDVYLVDADKIIANYHTGDLQPFNSRPLNHRSFLFPQTVAPKEKLRAIVRLQSTDTIYLPVKVWKSHDFFAADQHEVFLLGLFFGFLSIMLIYNLLLYFSTNQKSYLYYVFFTGAIIYFQLTQKGLGYQYFWPEKIFFNHMSIPLSAFIAMITSSLFILNFLNLKKEDNAKIIFTLKAGIGLPLFIIATGYFMPYEVLLQLTAAMGAASALVPLIILVNLSFKGNQSAQILTVAWLFLLNGTLLFVLGRLGLQTQMLVTENAMLIGSTMEAALISFALARNIKKERDARMLAQESALRYERKTRETQNSLLLLQKQTTQHLEEKVKERTHKLETAMHSLTKANCKLDQLARLDGLTGIFNRRHFNQQIEYEWQRIRRQKDFLSLMLIDIDHFKQVNDDYGHLFGDQCLIQMGAILKNSVQRPEDIVARYGGEEFIIMLPNTNISGAHLIAERVRQCTERLRLDYRNKQVQFTVSIGISSMIPRQGSST
ncbi:MAG: Unknown protein, partial [uncultured Thiotrichaceae bacterium]